MIRHEIRFDAAAQHLLVPEYFTIRLGAVQRIISVLENTEMLWLIRMAFHAVNKQTELRASVRGGIGQINDREYLPETSFVPLFVVLLWPTDKGIYQLPWSSLRLQSN